MENIDKFDIINKAKEGKVQIINFGALPELEVVAKDIGEATVMIKRRIPYEEVLYAIQWSIGFIMDDRTFISAPLQAIIQDIALLKFYTNIDCSEIEVEGFSSTQLYEWYDILNNFNVPNEVKALINKEQYDFFVKTLNDTLHSLVAYRNSAAGIIDKLAEANGTDKKDLNAALDMLKEGENAEQLASLVKVIENIIPPSGV